MKAQHLKKENGLGLGVDIELIQNLPAGKDFSYDSFYLENFSAEEIKYCKGQHNTIESFAGLFCAKEALVKADNTWQGVKFNEISILHDAQGKPILQGYEISISHAGDYAIGVVQSNSSVNNLNKKLLRTKILAILSTLLALISIAFHFIR